MADDKEKTKEAMKKDAEAARKKVNDRMRQIYQEAKKLEENAGVKVELVSDSVTQKTEPTMVIEGVSKIEKTNANTDGFKLHLFHGNGGR